MILRRRSCAAVLLTVGVALYTESAFADAAALGAPAAPTCSVAVTSSATGLTLPANAPALLVVDRSSSGSAPTLQSALVNGATRTELAAVTDTNGLWTLALPNPSAGAGTYSVEIATSCPSISDAQKTVTSLTLTAPVAFPTSVGTLVHVPTDPPTGVDKVRLEPTEGMRAFMAAASLALSVDGVRSGPNTLISATSAFELTVNTGDVCIENGALHREKRVVKVTLAGTIAGVAESPGAASIEVPVDCGAIKWTSSSDPGNGPTGSNDSMPTTDASSDGGGCSASPVANRGGGAGLFAFALGGLGLVAMRRRRRH